MEELVGGLGGPGDRVGSRGDGRSRPARSRLLRRVPLGGVRGHGAHRWAGRTAPVAPWGRRRPAGRRHRAGAGPGPTVGRRPAGGRRAAAHPAGLDPGVGARRRHLRRGELPVGADRGRLGGRQSSARPTDLDLLPAWTEGAIEPGDRTAGPDDVPVDPALGPDRRVRREPIGRRARRPGPAARPSGRAARAGGDRRSASVVDPPVGRGLALIVAGAPWWSIFARWSGPLCAHLLGRSGMTVVKVEDLGRADGARRGDPACSSSCTRGHQQVAFDFAGPGDRRARGPWSTRPTS